jgi:hypothetical protein
MDRQANMTFDICQYGCNSLAKYRMSSGKWCCSEHWNSCPGKRLKDSNKKKNIQIPWNKGMTGLKGHPHTQKTKDILSEHAKRNSLGGYVKGSGRGKKGYYEGIWCDSSWELAYILYCKDHSIQIQRNTKRFNYYYKNKKHTYLPDFIRTDRENYFIEIKGIFNEKEIAKIKNFPHKLKILSGNGFNKILKYVISTYGRNFIELYNGE